MTLDVEATIRATAAAGRTLPILRPGEERRFSADLVLDVSPSMQPWNGAFAELVDVFAHVGAFREVRPWRLHVDGDDVSLADRFERHYRPGTFQTTDRRRVVIIVTDAVAEHWYRPVIWRHIADWGSSGMVALIDLLPLKLWNFSGIGMDRVRAHAAAAAAANADLSYNIPRRWRLTGRPAIGAVPVPVVELSPTGLAQWSAMVATAHPAGNAALLLESGAPRGAAGPPPSNPDGKASLTNFLHTASPEALRLAVLAATSDSTTLAVLRAIQQELLPGSTASDLAEVLVSGIFQHVPDSNAADLRILMNADCRAELQALASPQDRWNVYRAVSAAIRRASPESAGSFQAAVHDLRGNITVREDQQAFAEVARSALAQAHEMLADLAPGLQADLQSRAQVAATADEPASARLLAGLAPNPSPDQQAQALEAAFAISDELDRAQALADLAPHLPADLLQAAPDASSASAEESNRAQALSYLGALGEAAAAGVTYPAAGDFYKAVQVPARTFTLPKLQRAEFLWDTLGPMMARGSNAVIFHAMVDGSPQALRFYIRSDASSRERYSALSDFLAGHDLDPFVSPVTWIDSAIRVKGATWPVLMMEWIDGRTLNEYVDFLVASSNTAALTTLATRWRELIALLQNSEFGHGDLQHGNVMIDQKGTLRLIDFDGIWIPQLAGLAPPAESGHPNYQHPGQQVWGRWLDTFPALVIYLSLVALAKDPGLWLTLYNAKNLLFSKSDFYPPFETEAWKALALLRDPEVDELAQRLRECCASPGAPTGSLEMLLGRDLEDRGAAADALEQTQLPRPPADPAPEVPGRRADRAVGQGSDALAGQIDTTAYGRAISLKNPGCVVILLDRSDSMKASWGNSQETLAQGAARALNEIVLELLFASQGEPGKARYYFDVGVFGYGIRPVAGGEGVEPAFGGRLAGLPLVALPDLRDNPIAVREIPSADPGAPPSRVPVWVEPAHGYRRPLCQAIAVAGGHIYEWASVHRDSFPPIIINITAGMVTDSPYEGADLAEWAQRLTGIQTNDGAALFFNIFLSPATSRGVLFPATDVGLPEPGPQLFRISSPLPPPMIAGARSSGTTVESGARGFGFNADATMLIRSLSIGTRAEMLE